MQLPFAVRDLGQRLFRRVPMRIASGINKHMKWSIVITDESYGSGASRSARLEALRAILRPGDCVWDVGAHKGFITLAAARLVADAR